MSNDDEIVIDLREIAGILRKRLSMIVGIALLFLACAAGYCFVKPPVYEATATIKVPAKQIDILKSRNVIEPVMEKLVDRDKDGRLPAVNGWIKNNVKITQEKGSEFHKVTVQGSSPERATEIGNAIIEGGIKRYKGLSFLKLDADIKYAEENLHKAKARVEESMRILHEVGGSRDIIAGQISNALMSQQQAEKQLGELKKKRQDVEFDFWIIDAAMANNVPVAPRKGRICAIALIMGVMIGCIGAVVKEKMFN